MFTQKVQINKYIHNIYIYFNLDDNESVKNEYSGIFPLCRNPKEDKHLERFENNLYDLIKSLKFRKVKNPMFTKIRNDLNEIKKSNKTIAFADKSQYL